MSDREALAAALAELERWMKRREVGAAPPLTTVLAAARERLAQLEGTKLTVWWCTEHGASFQQEAILGPPTWNCWAGPIEDEPCVPLLLDAYKAAQ